MDVRGKEGEWWNEQERGMVAWRKVRLKCGCRKGMEGACDR